MATGADFSYMNPARTSIFFIQQDWDNRWTVKRQRIFSLTKNKNYPMNNKTHSPSWAKWFDTKGEAQKFLDEYADAHEFIVAKKKAV